MNKLQLANLERTCKGQAERRKAQGKSSCLWALYDDRTGFITDNKAVFDIYTDKGYKVLCCFEMT